MILNEQQRLGLDEAVSRYLGSLDRPGAAAPAEVTVRRTLGHVAGFPTHFQYFFDDRPERPLPFAETLRCFGAEIHQPGTEYTYSNLGYGVLGETIARVSGQRYREFLAREVFVPLGLKRASVPERSDETAGAAKRYGRDGGLLPFFVTDFPGGSALYATVEDLVRFGSFHAGAPIAGQRAVLTPASLAAMHQGGLGDYGLGWSVNRTWHRNTIVWHSGAMPGSSAALWLMPAERAAVAVVANQIGAPVNQLAGELLAAVVPAEPQPASPALPQPPSPATRTGATPAAVPLGRFRGRLLTCPTPEPFVIDVRAANEVGVAMGTSDPGTREDATFSDGTLAAQFERPAGSRDTVYLLQLKAVGDRLAGPVTRRFSLGPRANVAVTLWAELERER